MLTLLMGFGENLEQFLPNCNWFALMTDHLSVLLQDQHRIDYHFRRVPYI